MTSRWADEIDEEDEQHIPQDIVLKDGERMVAEITTDPESGKKKKITRTFKLEKKFGKIARRINTTAANYTMLISQFFLSSIERHDSKKEVGKVWTV